MLALALIVLAPLFSQLRTDTQDWSWLSELACHDGMAQVPAPVAELPHTSKLDACGYCSLLINSPALDSQDWGYLRITVQRQTSQPLSERPLLLILRFPAAQSRAPPSALG
ncbi:DUF2946 domain-containing protein [Pseudomonas sp. SL4(2022)]|uniref:DUF2946 domain-containing protein n=1 Tax=Pseudomonas sp. SL4(2022) TaxID=2994661 RepID=UPI00226E285D|nr:DUF2946 domain-containing protein [Pseudomonas sp. SL4(2022)]WAC45263.1 DUF2946 domain-containing protein [Pseudomonas sp. SL4(2022)]